MGLVNENKSENHRRESGKGCGKTEPSYHTSLNKRFGSGIGMTSRQIMTLAVLLSLLLLASCGPTGKASGPVSRPDIQIAGSAPEPSPAPQPASPTGAASTQTPSTEPAQTPSPAEAAPKSQTAPTETGYTTLKLVPAGDATDDEIVKAMTLLQVELGVKPELKVKQVSRTGKGRDSVILVATELSSTKPIIAVVNALKNRDRFEGKLGDKILFNNNDLRFVCRLPVCAAVEDMGECPLVPGGYACAWTFGIVIWESAGQRVADASKGMPTRLDGGEEIIDTPINLYLNNKLLDYVYIPSNMTSAPITDMSITGNATGPSQKEAQKKAAADMDRIRDMMSRKLLPIEMNIIE